MGKSQIARLLLILGIVLIFTALDFVGIWFPTFDGGACQFIFWHITCIQHIGVAPGDAAGLLFAVAGDMIVALGVLLIVVSLVALLHRCTTEHGF